VIAVRTKKAYGRVELQYCWCSDWNFLCCRFRLVYIAQHKGQGNCRSSILCLTNVPPAPRQSTNPRYS